MSHPLSAASSWPAIARELLLVAGVYTAYRAGRVLTVDQAETARANARLVHHLETVVGLPSEAAIQGAVGSVRLFETANLYYVSAHFPVTIAFLVWGFVARPRAEYVWARNLLASLTLLGVLGHVLFPLAPPRMFPEWGFLDTMSVHGPSAYDGASGALVNQYAAMPSLHVGWAVLVAVVLARTAPWPLRVLGVVHASATTAVVIVTANHWLVDGAVGVGLLGLALVVFPGPRRGVQRATRPGHLEPHTGVSS